MGEQYSADERAMTTPRINPTVMKFGGTSVEDAEAFERVARIVGAAYGKRLRPVVVVSAMGGTTDALLACVRRAREGDFKSAASVLEEQLLRHAGVARELLGEAGSRPFISLAEEIRRELRTLFERVAGVGIALPALKDLFASCGERLSSALLSTLLRERGLPARHFDARKLIATDGEHGRAAPLLAQTYVNLLRVLGPSVENEEIPVLGGFIGAGPDGATTTLGRNGSDITAALIGAALRAAEVEIWSDVNGVLSADPRIVPDARSVPALSYEEAAELANFGAKVLHPSTIRPAAEALIPVRIRNSRAPYVRGTLVSIAEPSASAHRVKAVTQRPGVAHLRVTNRTMPSPSGFLTAVTESIRTHRADLLLLFSYETTAELVVNGTTSLAPLAAGLERFGSVEVQESRAVVCIVGSGLNSLPHLSHLILKIGCDAGSNLAPLKSSDASLLFLAPESDGARLVERVHRQIIAAHTEELLAPAHCFAQASLQI